MVTSRDENHIMFKKLSIFTFMILLSPSFCASAQQTNPSNASATSSTQEKRYLVEVIVFNYNGSISAAGEIWHRISPIEYSPEHFTSEESAVEELSPADELKDPVEYTELKELLPYLSKLVADPRYEVVTFTAWTQPLFEKKSAIRVELGPVLDPVLTIDEGTPFSGPAIEGSLQLFENRLLFVDLDLRNEIVNSDSGLLSVDSAQAIKNSGTFRIQEKRRVKLNEIHYFDHPFFGALVRVSRA